MPTIFEYINELCKDKFDDLWIMESERITRLYNDFIEFAQKAKSIKPTERGRTGYKDNYGFRHEDFAFAKVAPGKNYNTVTSSQYNQLVNMRTLTHRLEKMTLAGYLADTKKDWYEQLTAKLDFYLNKLLIDSDQYAQGSIHNSAKGYTIEVYFKRGDENKMLYTICFPAGGTNIQCFHYRYKGTLK